MKSNCFVNTKVIYNINYFNSRFYKTNSLCHCISSMWRNIYHNGNVIHL